MIFQNKNDIKGVIEKEEVLIGKYKKYLEHSSDEVDINSLEGLINKHSNHIEALQNMLGGN